MYKISVALSALLLSLTVTAAAYNVKLSGECVGVKVYTDGLIVTDTMTLTDVYGKKVNAANSCGIKKGDIIKKVNNTDAISANIVSEAVKDGSVNLTLLRNGKEFSTDVTPIQTNEGAKLGLWLRDSTAGLGTITCFIDNRFVGLGHGICDIDTGNIMPVRNGIIQDCSDISITKGEKGQPGAISGAIDGKKLGDVIANTHHGISGTILSPSEGKDIETADKSEIRPGKASILCDVDGKGVKEYEIEIKRIVLSQSAGKDMVIKITDDELIEKTGGIIQGMSGSPIIQNNKLIGAITHVFVNNPTRGYGIFIENMLAEAEKIK